MTKAERDILQKLNSVETKRMKYYELRKSVGLSIRGFYRVINRMHNARFLVRIENEVEITFGGLKMVQ